MATVSFERVFKRFGGDRRGRRRLQPRHHRRRVPGARRPVGLRQDDGAAHASPGSRRSPRADLRSATATSTTSRQGPRHRDGLPELRALPAHVGLRQHGLRAQAAQGARRPRSTRRVEEAAAISTSTPSWTASRRRSPAASASASRSAARSCASRGLPDGRAALQPGRQAARPDPRRDRKLHQRLGTTSIYVTHDQVEAMTMGDRIAVMNDGVLQQVDTPQELYDHPVQPVRRGLHRQPSMNFTDREGRRRTAPRWRPRASRSRSPIGLRETIRGATGERLGRRLPAGALRSRGYVRAGATGVSGLCGGGRVPRQRRNCSTSTSAGKGDVVAIVGLAAPAQAG